MANYYSLYREKGGIITRYTGGERFYYSIYRWREVLLLSIQVERGFITRYIGGERFYYFLYWEQRSAVTW